MFFKWVEKQYQSLVTVTVTRKKFTVDFLADRELSSLYGPIVPYNSSLKPFWTFYMKNDRL